MPRLLPSLVTTAALMRLLETRNVPDPKKACQLLEAGAGPWALARVAQEGVPVRSLFFLLYLKAPHPECMDAWFRRAGRITGEPWVRHGAPNPLHEIVESQTQPETFQLRMLDRLLAAGVAPTPPAGQRLGPWLDRHLGEALPQALEVVARHHPHLLLAPEHWEPRQRALPAFERLAVQASQAHLQQLPAGTPKGPTARL